MSASHRHGRRDLYDAQAVGGLVEDREDRQPGPGREGSGYLEEYLLFVHVVQVQSIKNERAFAGPCT
jgi:hypothetical protein